MASHPGPEAAKQPQTITLPPPCLTVGMMFFLWNVLVLCQMHVQDVDAETHLSMRPSLRLVCSDRPEGRLLPCLNPPSTQTVLRFVFEGQAYQYKALPFGLSLPSLEHCCVNTGIWSWTRSTSQHVSQRSALSQCWDAWSLSSTRGRFHWNIFRGSWGIWHPQPRSRRSDCFIWDRFSVGFTTGSWDGHGAMARTGSQSPRPAATPSAHGRTLLSLGRSSPRASIQACCCFNRCLYHRLGGTLGTDALACSWPRGLRKYAFPPVSLLAQTLCKVREDKEQVLLVAPYWPNRTWFPELMVLATAPPWQIPLRRDLLSQRRGTLWQPTRF